MVVMSTSAIAFAKLHRELLELRADHGWIEEAKHPGASGLSPHREAVLSPTAAPLTAVARRGGVLWRLAGIIGQAPERPEPR